ncbi:MAG: hypothetical protein PVJ27_02510 [Candidatus Brocadiaceae bacterium]|jgi:hypothetical protein
MDDLIIGLIFLGIIVFSVIKKALESLAEKTERGAARGGGYEASAREIQDFLKSLGVQQEPEEQPGRAPREQARAEARVQRAQAARRMGPPAGPPTAPRMRERRREPAKKRRKRRKTVPPQREEKPAATEPSEARQKVGPALPPSGRLSLKQAIVWSEILGPPVSLRRSRHHVPPATEK